MKVIVLKEEIINSSYMYYLFFIALCELENKKYIVIYRKEKKNRQWYINLEAAKTTITINKCHCLLYLLSKSLWQD